MWRCVQPDNTWVTICLIVGTKNGCIELADTAFAIRPRDVYSVETVQVFILRLELALASLEFGFHAKSYRVAD